MDSWERFDEKLLQNKKDNLNMEDITDVDYKHAKRVFKHFNDTNLGDYHDLCVQSDNYYLKMHLKILEINVLKYMNLNINEYQCALYGANLRLPQCS